jgi:hypothetical protein
VAWLNSIKDRDLHLSAVTLDEIQADIEITREQDSAKAADIETWADQVAITGIFCPWMRPRSVSGQSSGIDDPTH